MILPYLKGILGFSKIPVTWLLVLINIGVFLVFFSTSEKSRVDLNSFYTDESFVSTQGQVFSEFILRHPGFYSDFYTGLAKMVREGKRDQRMIIGALALRDVLFLRHGAEGDFSGDQVRIGRWRDKFSELAEIRAEDPSSQLGLGRLNDFNLPTWISYQFYHGGISHLFGNIFFLLLFGGGLEIELGGLAVLITYLVTGIFSAAVFVALSSVSAVPLVGASGSISGLMGLYVGMKWRRPIRFFYFILPAKGYTGMLYLPQWTALAMWALADLAGLIANMDDMGGVAHAAHVGGLTLGLLMGFFLLLGSETAPQSILRNAARLQKL